MEIDEVLENIKKVGPDRVIINEHGDGVSAKRAKEIHNIIPITIFIRNDGWSLGAAEPFEVLAYQLWRDEWSHVLLQSGDCMTIETFLNAMEELNQTRH